LNFSIFITLIIWDKISPFISVLCCAKYCVLAQSHPADIYFIRPVPRRVTSIHSGNNPANGLVTEIPQYSACFCFSGKWSIWANHFTYNRLTPDFTNLFSLAFRDFTYLARHTFATTITLSNGVPLETVSKMLGHTKISTTQIYARIVDQTINDEMDIFSISSRNGAPPLLRVSNLVFRLYGCKTSTP
jgi:hypothetical protein